MLFIRYRYREKLIQLRTVFMPDKVFKQRSFIMAGKMRNQNCKEQVQSKEYPQESLVFDPIENFLRTLVRFFAECFVTPWTRDLVRPTNYAAQHFGVDAGTIIAQQKLRDFLVIQKNKPSALNFPAPRSKICSEIVTHDERRFIAAIKSTRKGNLGRL